MRFNAGESFRAPFSVSNSEEAILRFPFPFRDDQYGYGMHLQMHGQKGPSAAYDAVFDIDEHYLGEMAEREIVLRADASRAHEPADLREAGWEALALVMTALAADFPALFSLTREGAAWRWRNAPLGIARDFIFGDAGTLPCGPLEYVSRQVQGDLVLLEERDGKVVMRGGVVTAAAGWSFAANLDRDFHHIHGPVPLARETGLVDRAQVFLARLAPGRPARRVGWGMTAWPRLDISTENRAVWAGDTALVTAGDVGRTMWLRVELQTLHRLARSGVILFGIRTYMLRLDEVARVRKWAMRLHRVLRTLHPEVAAYKGLAGVLPLVVDFLAPLDDGSVLGAGPGPEQTRL